MNNDAILNKLLEKILKNKNINKKDFISSGIFFTKHPNKSKYYFKNYEKNIYKLSNKMKNIIDKNHARAIYNSAVMIYNLLGENVIWDGEEYNVQYEKKLKVLNDDIKGKHIAHLDFLMTNKSKLIFGEAKMVEWMNSPKYLKEVYLLEKSYIDEEDKEFIKIFNYFIKTEKNKKHKTKAGFKSLYIKYDAFQMLIHILGIYRYVKVGKNNGITNIKLVNVVWGNKKINQYQKEKNEAMDFIKKANEIFKPMFKKYNVNFEIRYYNYDEFKDKIKFNDENRKKYLERYNILK